MSCVLNTSMMMMMVVMIRVVGLESWTWTQVGLESDFLRTWTWT